jgi:hypothetical protein
MIERVFYFDDLDFYGWTLVTNVDNHEFQKETLFRWYEQASQRIPLSSQK